jgi:hypothetical protein
MKALEANVFWTPNRPSFDRYPTKGTIDLSTRPGGGSVYHPWSVGACWCDWTDADDEGRRKLMQLFVTHMLHEDNLPLNAVRDAITQIDEFAEFPFSTEKP